MDFFRLGLFLLMMRGVAAQVQLEPKNATVLSGSQARFNCSTTLLPSIMTWMVNGRLVLAIQGTGVTNSLERFSARNFTTPGNFKWEFIISTVQRDDAGEVTCQIFGGDPQMAKLSVQERGSVGIIGGNRTEVQGVQMEFQCQAVGWFPAPTMSWSINGLSMGNCNSSSIAQGNLFNSNCSLTYTAVINSSIQCFATVPALSTPESSTVFLTVGPIMKATVREQTILIAVTVAVSAAALLYLLIIGIILCCKKSKSKKSNYQEEVRRAQSQNRMRENARGRVNRGYITDGRGGENQV
ncbi:immunoglobulin superfamily member 5 [Xyrauchen texanus]|uniref:immunoglobulin superfamily member 5 n=1 Tax=Xyrauchen texanus TaxID=154827 RepID=UPI002241EA0D|nr:immunoglobulin superfamily member 5 [Xyrauchen texanus]XP_051973658.1 immunoglobulin superfamily member 5 [Xyrauchen texanus]XP_051973659.1 immunoglobulin superfamily member 5 [Xyrauchen texanus]